jgi:hypothetical protein
LLESATMPRPPWWPACSHGGHSGLAYRIGKFHAASRLFVHCFSFQAVRPDRPNPSFPEKDADSGPSPGADVGRAKPPSRVPAPGRVSLMLAPMSVH